MSLELLCQRSNQHVRTINEHFVACLLVLDLGGNVVAPVLQIIILRLFTKAFLPLLHHAFFGLLAFFLSTLAFGLPLLELVLGSLRVSVILLALVVKDRQLLLSAWDNVPSEFLFKSVEVTVSTLDLINKASIDVSVVLASVVDLELQAVIFAVDGDLLLVSVTNLILKRVQMVVESTQLLVVLDSELMHFSFGFVTNGCSSSKRCLGVVVILLKILVHVAQLVKIAERALFIVHNDFLVLPDTFNDLLGLALERLVHALDVVALRFCCQEAKESFLFFLNVNWVGALGHAAGWVRSKAVEITKDVRSTGLLFGASSLVIGGFGNSASEKSRRA